MSKNNKMFSFLSEQFNPEIPSRFMHFGNFKIFIQDENRTNTPFQSNIQAIHKMIVNLVLDWEIKDNDDPYILGNTILTIASSLGELIREDVYNNKAKIMGLSNFEVLNLFSNEVISRKNFKTEYEQFKKIGRCYYA